MSWVLETEKGKRQLPLFLIEYLFECPYAHHCILTTELVSLDDHNQFWFHFRLLQGVIFLEQQ